MSSQTEQEFCYVAGVLYARPMGKEAHTKIGFGARLKKFREEAGLSGTALGKGLGATVGEDASRQTISDWESERHYPSVRQLFMLCLKLGKGADELLFGRTEPFADEKLATAAKAVGQLTAGQRAELLALLEQPGVSDAHVESKMPVTRKRAKQPS